MEPDRIARALRTSRFGRPLLLYEVVDSTNSRLAALAARGGLAEGTTFVARRQTRGRGTAGKRWWSDDDRGLWFSVLLREPLAKQPLSFVPGIALVDAIAETSGVRAWLKWPNDVYVDDRKLAGILVESVPRSEDAVAWVVGVGVNVDQTDLPEPVADTAVSLRLLTGRRQDLEALLVAFLERFEEIYDDPRFDPIEEFRARSRMLGHRLRARRGKTILEGVARDVTPEGHLEVMLADGRLERWVSVADLDVLEVASD